MRRRECCSPSKWQTTSTKCSKVLGPAILPSLDVCPTSIVAMLNFLAACMRAADVSYVWFTPPTLPSISVLLTVCTESTIRISGLFCSMCPKILPRSVSALKYRLSARAFMRSARSFT